MRDRKISIALTVHSFNPGYRIWGAENGFIILGYVIIQA